MRSEESEVKGHCEHGQRRSKGREKEGRMRMGKRREITESYFGAQALHYSNASDLE